MDLGLSGKRVLITGGSGGIGAAIARELAAEGARLAINFIGDRTRVAGLAGLAVIDGGMTLYPSFAHGG